MAITSPRNIVHTGFQSGRFVADDNTYVNLADLARESYTQFAQLKTAEKSPQIVLNSDLPLSTRRDDITETNNGTVTRQDAEYRLRATTDSGSLAKLSTKQRGKYVAGVTLEAGLGVRIPTAPTGDAYVKWGYYDNGNGIYFLYESTGLYCVVENDGTVVSKVEQADWNWDTLDGSGLPSGGNSPSNPSGGVLDLADGHLFQFPFVYYGYGADRFEVSIKDRFGKVRVVTVHEFNMEGEITIAEPNLPLTAEVSSGTSGAQLDAFVGGRQISIVGKDDNIKRSTGAYRLSVTGVNTNFRPLISFRIKDAYKQIPIRLQAFQILSDADFVVEIQKNATLNGASFGNFGNYVANECATEWDVSANTTYTSGETLFHLLADGAAKSDVVQAELPDRPIFEDDVITLAIRTVSASNASISASFKVQEDW